MFLSVWLFKVGGRDKLGGGEEKKLSISSEGR